MTTRRIVQRVEDGMDRQGIEATTYQMRNFYLQLRDGYFSGLDIFNYVQHHQIALWAGKVGGRLLDVCCGRGLMLPLLRWHAKELEGYMGVDIHPPNATYRTKRVTDGAPIDEGYYPWPVDFLESNVAEMAAPLLAMPGFRPYSTIVYTSAIEHMHPDAGLESLRQCRAVAAPGAWLYLTCPNTPADQDGYDTRYRAHVYEWKRDELLGALARTGWEVQREWGLMIGARELRAAAEPLGLGALVDRLAAVMPREWYCPLLAPMFPREASEIAFAARAT